ncbi:extracellular solute-binding protein, partial [Streptomyces griseolus]|uniref:extracellular solute-binding protein n=1 Tax=Streptomyces griseolus TaxID=1909 RepID=UPI0022439AC1
MTISKTQRGRAAAAVSLTAVLALTATACGDDGSGSGGEGSGKGEITFWDNNGGPRTAIWTEIIKNFEKKYPDIKVKYVPIPIADVQSKYDTAIAGGGLPDVGGVGTAYLANMVSQEALEPLNKRLEGSTLKGKLVDGMVQSVTAAAGRGDDLYSIPTSANNGVLWDCPTSAVSAPPTSPTWCRRRPSNRSTSGWR